MKPKDLAIALFALLLVGALVFLWLSPSGTQRAPEVAVETLDGGSLSLAELRGRPVLVTFWATTCTTCVAEIPHLAELHRELGPEGFTIIAVAMPYDPPPQVKQMASERDMPYTVALDREGTATAAFGGVKVTPTHFLIAPDGRIVQKKLGQLDTDRLKRRVQGMLAQGAA